MSSQAGLKHVATEPTRLEGKHRRRGASGRAAALRRAPSDSDCSGETASLSADSGDRSVRPALPPPRIGKSRSRRRGSEWEVLEGLKDGQRFEKRPEVFNGYLHKKRKWPLKGWHKRFFVVDGGILVYARSPTDVARGRLHGSVDVGLSVISAKARRRRIDIDADEFIYHLRAKTPDVFRTWLNVLKTHRLYRQHLLTFGARESVPKIHAPVEDLPPTDTSSRTSYSSSVSSLENKEYRFKVPHCLVYPLCTIYPQFSKNEPYADKNKAQVPVRVLSPSENNDYFKYDPLTKETFEQNSENIPNTHRKLTSIHCLFEMSEADYAKEEKVIKDKSPVVSLFTTDAEKQMHSTDLEINVASLKSSLFCDYSINSPMMVKKYLKNETKQITAHTQSKQNVQIDTDTKDKSGTCTCNKEESTPTFYFFTRKKQDEDDFHPPVRRSRKSIDVHKYRNFYEEPKLKSHQSKYMLLKKYKLNEADAIELNATISQPKLTVTKRHADVQVKVHNGENKIVQSSISTSEYDSIAEKLMCMIHEDCLNSNQLSSNIDLKDYLNNIIQELHELKFNNNTVHPVKNLFASLLKYWLNNTSSEYLKDIIKKSKSIDKPSIKHFTQDQAISNIAVLHITKATQFCGISDLIIKGMAPKLNINKTSKKHKLPTRINDSYEKERRIQELERILKNTVYICETIESSRSKENDIKITKKLIDNLDKLSQRNSKNKTAEVDMGDNSNSSNELPKIQETLNNLINEASIPPGVAKEFFGVYLDLLHESQSQNDTNSSSDEPNVDIVFQPKCDVQAEPVQKKVSRSISTKDFNVENDKFCTKNVVDPGQMYLKDVLDKITTIFSKEQKATGAKQNVSKKANDWNKNKAKQHTNLVRDKLGNVKADNRADDSFSVDISKYNLEHISLTSDPALKGMASIKMKLTEKPLNSGENKPINLNFRFSSRKLNLQTNKITVTDGDSDNIFKTHVDFPNFNTNRYIDTYINKDAADLKPYLSSGEDCEIQPHIAKSEEKPYFSESDATSKGYRVLNETCDSTENNLQKDIDNTLINNDDPQPCYVLSLKKNVNVISGPQSKKNNDDNENTVCTQIDSPSVSSSQNCNNEISLFEKTPKAIDEKFILLLLENLCIMSKNLPSLHKDIHNLFIKLRKKHEKLFLKSNKSQGLSLLGKIYNEECNIKSTEENETQFDETVFTKNNNLTNTSDQLLKKSISDKALSAEVIEKENKIVQTPHSRDRKSKEPDAGISQRKLCGTSCTNAQNTSFSSLSSEEDIQRTNKAVSNQNWYRQIRTRDCAISTLIKCVLNASDSAQNFRLTGTNCEGTPNTIDRAFPTNRNTQKEKRIIYSKIKQDLITEIKLLSPHYKVSTQSQTEKKLRCLKNKKTTKDFSVYQLFVGQKYDIKRSCSMIDSNAKIRAESDDLKTIYRCSSDPSYVSGLVSPTAAMRGPQAGFVSGTPGGRLAGWIIESGGPLDSASRELGQAQLSVQQLQRLLDALELHQQTHHDTDVSVEGASPNVKKDRRKFGLRKKKSNSKCASVELQPPHIDPSNSHMALSALTAPPSPGGGASSIPASAASLPIACAATRPQSLPGAEALNAPASLSSLTPDHQLREDFTVLAKDLVSSLKSVVATLVCERGRLRAVVEAGETAAPTVVAALRTNLSTALQQNSELRSRLSRIHDASDLAEVSSVGNHSEANRQFQQSLSYSSSCVSASEFFDAEEHEEDLKQAEILHADEAGVIELDGDSTSEAGSLSSEEGSASSDNSDGAMVSTETARSNGPAEWARRTRLPSPRPSPGGPSLWNLLYKNIGKDLSQISMPVTINEPLNMLQRLCEELEYSELLDAASSCPGASERAALVAAFAVSAYASAAHRAASKPFNPLLAETYECVRADRAFRFVAEQVSHHPPISACHAESPRWLFWQEARIKTKFWGKSMEFQPAGRVHVRLLPSGDHYSWNKVTTCVHNLFGGQRWVDQYGDMHIACHGTDIVAKLNFIKASSWSSSRHEVRGAVSQGASGARLRLAGRWSEALYAGDPPAAKCLWRPGAMPAEHELYYGFTRFAMELNEMEPGLADTLPHTDTRFRPDQRALEEGDVDAAEEFKHRLEQAQRERRRDCAEHTPSWFRKVVEDGEECWQFTGEYWKAREAGFPTLAAPRLW